ncbi:MAG: hypothetical protein ACR2HR_16120 [Euzebya sp.]
MRRLAVAGLLVLIIAAVLAPVVAAQTPTAPNPAPTVELPSIEGAANPLDAPLVGVGSFVDTILQTETLWYALDAQPGQRVGATVGVIGRPGDPVAADTFLEVTVTDQQRQPLEDADSEFRGDVDVFLELATAEVPPIAGNQPLLSVGLRSATGQADLAGVGYRLQVTVVIDGTPVAVAEPDSGTAGPGRPEPTTGPTVTTPPVPPPGDPQPVRDLTPFALVALAVGGFAGFELSRRGL